jgi:hypothetical protein
MTDPTTFSYTFPVNPAPKRPEPDSGLFAVDQLSEFPLGSDTTLMRNPRNGQVLVVPADYVNPMIGFCSLFRPLDEHVAELMKGSDGSLAREAAIRKVVQSFRDGGLTISAAEICAELAPTPPAPVTEKPVVVIITCDRPRTLERLLDSVLANCNLDAIDSLFVVDDSRSVENAARNREATEIAGQQATTGFHYFGASEACEMRDSLVSQLPEFAEAIRFLIDRDRWQDQKSYGVARNFSHLLSIGKPVVVFDDDTLCEAYDAPFADSGVAFTNQQREAVFFAQHDEWRQELTQRSVDPVAGHMQCLGLTVPQALSSLEVEQLDQDILRPTPLPFALSLGRGSRVLITECGALGDPGTGTNRWLANMPAASRERLAATEGRLQLALSQRCCWLGRSRPTFRPNGTISQVTGFDNRGFLPPYFPITRGEDRLFGEMVHYIYPQSVALDYGWASPHLPLEQRGWSNRENSYAIGMGFPGGLANNLARDPESSLASDPASRTAFLARLFQDLAAAPDNILFNRAVEDRHDYRASQLRKLQARIAESAGLPEHWRRYLEDALRQVESSRPDKTRMESFKSGEVGLEGAALVRFWRDAWQRFGDALSAWNDIREAAREIVAKKYGA